MKLEADLRNALRRQSPPEGFSQRVLARIAPPEAPRRPSGARHPWWRAAAASVVLAAVLTGYATHRVAEQRRLEGEHARQQVLLAMRIAGEKVRYARDEVRALGEQDVVSSSSAIDND